MKTTQKQAYNRLLKKLSALRATLSNEERAILDSMISADEVQAHKLNDRATGKAISKTTNKATQVQAHKLNDRATGKAISKTTNKATQVQAHKLNDRATGKAISKTTNKTADKTTARIAFDPNSEEYRITD